MLVPRNILESLKKSQLKRWIAVTKCASPRYIKVKNPDIFNTNPEKIDRKTKNSIHKSAAFCGVQEFKLGKTRPEISFISCEISESETPKNSHSFGWFSEILQCDSFSKYEWYWTQRKERDKLWFLALLRAFGGFTVIFKYMSRIFLRRRQVKMLPKRAESADWLGAKALALKDKFWLENHNGRFLKRQFCHF